MKILQNLAFCLLFVVAITACNDNEIKPMLDDTTSEVVAPSSSDFHTILSNGELITRDEYNQRMEKKFGGPVPESTSYTTKNVHSSETSPLGFGGWDEDDRVELVYNKWVCDNRYRSSIRNIIQSGLGNGSVRMVAHRKARYYSVNDVGLSSHSLKALYWNNKKHSPRNFSGEPKVDGFGNEAPAHVVHTVSINNINGSSNARLNDRQQNYNYSESFKLEIGRSETSTYSKSLSFGIKIPLTAFDPTLGGEISMSHSLTNSRTETDERSESHTLSFPIGTDWETRPGENCTYQIYRSFLDNGVEWTVTTYAEGDVRIKRRTGRGKYPESTHTGAGKYFFPDEFRNGQAWAKVKDVQHRSPAFAFKLTCRNSSGNIVRTL